MNLRTSEDRLFRAWSQKYDNFVIDGAPNPDLFLGSKNRTIFVLKDINAPDHTTGLFDLRKQLATEPHPWWQTVGTWCRGISSGPDSNMTWADLRLDARAEPSQLRKALASFAFIQLKKTSGKGGVSNTELGAYAESDAKEICEQVFMYEPRIVIAAGVGEILSRKIDIEADKMTARGVPYTEHKSPDGKGFYVIHFCHPSARVPRNILCYALLDAYFEICESLQ